MCDSDHFKQNQQFKLTLIKLDAKQFFILFLDLGESKIVMSRKNKRITFFLPLILKKARNFFFLILLLKFLTFN